MIPHTPPIFEYHFLNLYDLTKTTSHPAMSEIFDDINCQRNGAKRENING